MLWLYAIIGELVLETFIAVRYRHIAQKHPHDAALRTALMYGYGVMPVALMWYIVSGSPQLVIQPQLLVLTVIASTLFATANILVYRAYSHLNASHYGIINTFKYVVVVVIASLLLHDNLSQQQWIGSLIIIVASIIASAKPVTTRSSKKIRQYIFIAIIASTLSGLATVVEKFIVSSVEISVYIIIGWGLQSVIQLLFARPRRDIVRAIRQNKQLSPLILIGVMRGIGGVLFVFALSNSQNAALVASVAASKVILITLAGIIFLREQSNIRTILTCAIMAFTGIVLIVLG
ncbi:MAG: EamA family transporter [Candidatus Saccharimonas sp.]|nr:EamA family transporter [Candidatus Saccharimonas sp.]